MNSPIEQNLLHFRLLLVTGAFVVFFPFVCLVVDIASEVDDVVVDVGNGDVFVVLLKIVILVGYFQLVPWGGAVLVAHQCWCNVSVGAMSVLVPDLQH